MLYMTRSWVRCDSAIAHAKAHVADWRIRDCVARYLSHGSVIDSRDGQHAPVKAVHAQQPAQTAIAVTTLCIDVIP